MTTEGGKRIILVLNYNGADDTIRCLDSLLSDSAVEKESIVVVDNASTDGSPNIIFSRYPNIRIIINPANLGFAGGFNRAIRLCLKREIESFLLLNNDVIVREGAVTDMAGVLEIDRSIGAVGPVVLHMGTDTIQSAGIRISWLTGRSTGMFDGQKIADARLCLSNVDSVSGCAMMISSEAFEKAGFFREDFFMFAEELDFCLRLKKAGFKVIYSPQAIVEHKSGSTVSRYPGLRERYSTRNRVLVMRRHASIGSFVISSIWLMLLEMPLAALKDAACNLQATTKAWSRLRGLMEGLFQSTTSESR